MVLTDIKIKLRLETYDAQNHTYDFDREVFITGAELVQVMFKGFKSGSSQYQLADRIRSANDIYAAVEELRTQNK